MNLKFYTSVEKGLQLKVRECWGLVPMSVEVTGEGAFWQGAFLTPPPSHILNRVNTTTYQNIFELRLGGILQIIVLKMALKSFQNRFKIYRQTCANKLVENIVREEQRVDQIFYQKHDLKRRMMLSLAHQICRYCNFKKDRDRHWNRSCKSKRSK